MKTIILTFALFALSASAEGQSAKAPAAQKLPDPLSNEKWFVGTWICKGTQHASPMGPAEEFTDRFSFHMALRGSWLLYQIDQLKGPVKGNQTLIGSVTWDANAKVHVRRDMNIGGSRVDVTSPGWDGDKMVYTGYMVAGDEKLPVKHTFTKKGDAAYDSALEVIGADGKVAMWEEESCKKVSGARATTPYP
ncbi:MAG TPA: hypothetical protein VJY15_00315 [Candidatus Acidoferrum sp.]|nr:hypothetical protein [Candidatus Acidoferrum sp.]